MKKAVRYTLLAALLAGAAVLVYPWIDSALYAMRLCAMPAPATLPVPVADVKPSGLADTWQAARAPGRRHEGIDIFAKKGTPVLSATDGLVLRRGLDSLGGNVVWVLGPAGHRHYYAHLDTFARVETGDRVRAGTVLGTVGNTGNARTTPPHLHYGVYAIGGAINPYPLLAPGPARR